MAKKFNGRSMTQCQRLFLCNLIHPTDYLGVCDNLIQFFFFFFGDEEGSFFHYSQI